MKIYCDDCGKEVVIVEHDPKICAIGDRYYNASLVTSEFVLNNITMVNKYAKNNEERQKIFDNILEYKAEANFMYRQLQRQLLRRWGFEPTENNLYRVHIMPSNQIGMAVENDEEREKLLALANNVPS